MLGLVCIDVDGTLVGSANTVHPAIWEAAARVRAAGVRLCLCSGRPGFGLARQYAERLDPDGWHVFQNGASVLDVATGASRSQPLPLEALAMLHARNDADWRCLELYTDADYAVAQDVDLARRHAALLGVPFRPRPLDALDGTIVRAQWLTTHGQLDRVLAEPHDGLAYAASSSPAMPDAAFVNVTRAGVDKGTAIRAVAEAHGVPLERTMMVGDGLNDLSALRVVGVPVAMQNAEPEVRAIAAHVVGHVDAAGLVQALDLALAL